jgi:acyl-CoA dehydrogenase
MFTRTVFEDEHEIFRTSVRRFIQDHITPHHDRWEQECAVDRQAWLLAGEAGLLCATLPEKYGGAGADLRYSLIVTEELARANASGPGFWLHSDIVAPYILKFATDSVRDHWLPKMASGQAIGAVGMTEPGGGSDVQNIRTTARRDGDDYVINGQKVFISNGGSCDLLVLACRTGPESGAAGLSLILVPADSKGFSRNVLSKLGGKAQDTAELFFDDVRVPAGNLLGEEGRGFQYLMQELAQERLLTCVRSAATLEAAVEWTLDYVTDRKAFGRTVADFQNTRFKLAEVQAEAVAMRVLVDKCIELHLNAKLESADAALAKMFSTERLGRGLDTLMQFFGGYCYTTEYPIGKAWVDARASRIAGGSSEIMREIVGRAMINARK